MCLNTHQYQYPVFYCCHMQLVEAIVLPMTHKERFENIGVQPPKGTLTSVKKSLISDTVVCRCVVVWGSWHWQDTIG